MRTWWLCLRSDLLGVAGNTVYSERGSQGLSIITEILRIHLFYLPRPVQCSYEESARYGFHLLGIREQKMQPSKRVEVRG
jgi:hypothetical protein